MRIRQVKDCTFLHGNCIKNLLQCQKVHLRQSLEKFRTVEPRKLING